MLLPLQGRRIYYDLTGPEDGPVVCITHSLASDGGSWAERMNTVRQANSLEPLANGTVERWFSDAFKPRNPGRWKQIRDTVAATTPAGFLGCSAAIMNFDFA